VERLRSQLEESTFTFNGCELRATASFGIAGIDGVAASGTLEEVLASADAALYSAKSRGRNRIEVAKRG
jgi:diguanylate cyclase (GGDEF)-like protein